MRRASCVTPAYPQASAGTYDIGREREIDAESALVLHRAPTRTPIAEVFADLLLETIAAQSGRDGS